jgi:TolA-binding protein
LIPSLLLGIRKVILEMGRFDEAWIKLEGLIDGFPESSSAPEAIYLRGVSLFRNTNDSSNLKEAYERLQATYPESEWTKRAYPYRLL